MKAEELIEKIYKVFPPNALGDGVSWAQSVVIDNYGTPEEEKEARKEDAHVPWPTLVDDPNWEGITGLGGFCFLDAKGFRHYLPVAMIRMVHSGVDEGISLQLNVSLYEGQNAEKLSELNVEMRQLVAEFLTFMVDKDLAGAGDNAEEWQQLLDSYWGQFLPKKK